MSSEFERKVRKIMEELRADPSAEVWQRIQERIKENKRKRRVLSLRLCHHGSHNFSGGSDPK